MQKKVYITHLYVCYKRFKLHKMRRDGYFFVTNYYNYVTFSMNSGYKEWASNS